MTASSASASPDCALTPDPDLSSDKDRPGPPIVVDLDGTLLLTDTLEEGVAALGAARPLGLAQAALALTKGRAAFKRAIAGRITLDVALLPRARTLSPG